MVRGSAVLPFSIGKPVRICVFAEGAAAAEARTAGARPLRSCVALHASMVGQAGADSIAVVRVMAPLFSAVVWAMALFWRAGSSVLLFFSRQLLFGAVLSALVSPMCRRRHRG